MPENAPPSHPAEKTDDMQPLFGRIQEAEAKEKSAADESLPEPSLQSRPAPPIPLPLTKKQNGLMRILLIGVMLVIGSIMLLLGGLATVYYNITTQYHIDEGAAFISSFLQVAFPLFAIGGIVFLWGLILLVKQMPKGLGLIASLVGVGLIVGLLLLGGDIAQTPFFLGPYPLVTYQGHGAQFPGVNAVAWSPDGKRIASVYGDGIVQVWDAVDGKHVLTYRGHFVPESGWLYSGNVVAWSPDGKRIASAASNDGTVQVWDAVDGKHVYTYRDPGVNAVAWSPDGKRIACVSGDGTVQAWDAVDGRHVFTYRGQLRAGAVGDVNAVAWSPDGKRIASASGDGIVQAWDAVDGRHVSTYRGHFVPESGGAFSVNAVAWSPDGKRIAYAGGYTVQVWDAVDGRLVFTYRGRSAWLNAVSWSPDGKRIAYADGYTGYVEVLDATSGVIISSYNRYYQRLTALAWSPDGKRLAVGYEDQTVRIWDAS